MSQISKNHIKHIRSLQQQKFRKETQTYIVEGDKSVREWLTQKAQIELLVGTENWLNENFNLLKNLKATQILTATEEDLEKISGLKTANHALLVVKMNETKPIINQGWILMLDKIQDPGNMGTIIRTADWFGIKQILLSHDCVEIYNPKVVQATMGSLLRLNFSTEDLAAYLSTSDQPKYAAILAGKDLKSVANNAQPGIIIMGNESKGISEAVIELASHPITIPKIGGAESLNVAVATGIILNSLIN